MSAPPPPRRRAPSPSEPERAEMRRVADELASYGYEKAEADHLVWDGYRGGMAGVAAVATVLADMPTVGAKDIVF